MRQNQNAKRSRGRGRRSGNSGQNSFNRNSTFESNGPEGRLRGNAQQLFEKYTSLAHDAQSSGDRVLFEANSQFADHYYRIHQSILANAEQRRQNDGANQGKKGNAKAEADKADIASTDTAEETPTAEIVEDKASDADEAPADTSGTEDEAEVA